MFPAHKGIPQQLNHAKKSTLAHLYSWCSKRDTPSPLSLGDVLHEEMKTKVGIGEAEAWHLAGSRGAEWGTKVLNRVLVPQNSL